MFLGIRHCTELHCQLNLFLNILSNLNRFIIKLNCQKPKSKPDKFTTLFCYYSEDIKTDLTIVRKSLIDLGVLIYMKMEQLELVHTSRYISIMLFCALTASLVSTPAFAQQTNFGAILSGKNLSPPVKTIASGTAKFNVDAQGNMSYQLDVKNIKGVIGAHISLQNGTDLAQVFNPYVEIAGKSEIPTGEVNGQLSKGVLTTRDLSGILIGKNVTDLTNLMNNGSVYVVVRTQANENGEIQGQVTPSNTTGK